MDVMKNKKGFTLIELLAVIVILSIIILIAASNIGAMTTTARKNVLAVEGNTLVDGAKTAYQLAVLNGDITNNAACFSIAYLYNEGYFDKGPSSNSGYFGSVLIEPDANGKIYTYTFWISNGSYMLENAASGATGKVATNHDATKETALNSCGGTKLTTFDYVDGKAVVKNS